MDKSTITVGGCFLKGVELLINKVVWLLQTQTNILENDCGLLETESVEGPIVTAIVDFLFTRVN